MPNILQRNCIAEKPNENWVTDITEFKLFGEKLYITDIRFIYRGRLLLIQSVQNQPIHLDQGGHYQMKKYCHALQEHKITQSISRKGNCYDNAVIENKFGKISNSCPKGCLMNRPV